MLANADHTLPVLAVMAAPLNRIAQRPLHTTPTTVGAAVVARQRTAAVTTLGRSVRMVRLPATTGAGTATAQSLPPHLLRADS